MERIKITQSTYNQNTIVLFEFTENQQLIEELSKLIQLERTYFIFRKI